MNIKDAKEQIANAMRAYFARDAFGNYVIPIEKQRPVFLMGPPGIGKTAIMEQIAQEMGVALVSYSMTHHTRQSALGLPYIAHKTYGGREYAVSEYTMSEIIAACYDAMEDTGLTQGILFLDEINCVSETLAPSMLQFLQYKIFGRHRVPEGWIVVTAGNPPEYNNSVREFDTVTWDRLKRIDVEPDLETWKQYAVSTAVHPAITTYLDIKKGDFYQMETTVDGKQFVTARGWSDLSDMLRLYEENGVKADERLMSQYLQSPRIAKEFSVYYDLFNKYRSDYQVDRILAGDASQAVKDRAKAARFDERLSLLGLLLDAVNGELRGVCGDENAQTELLAALRAVKLELIRPGADAAASLQKQIEQRRRAVATAKRAGTLSQDDLLARQSAVIALEEQVQMLASEEPADGKAAFALLKSDYDRRGQALRERAERAGKQLSNLFRFCEEVFAEGQEMVILVTELTISRYGARFIARYGCDEYFAHNRELLFYQRHQQIIAELGDLEL